MLRGHGTVSSKSDDKQAPRIWLFFHLHERHCTFKWLETARCFSFIYTTTQQTERIHQSFKMNNTKATSTLYRAGGGGYLFRPTTRSPPPRSTVFATAQEQMEEIQRLREQRNMLLLQLQNENPRRVQDLLCTSYENATEELLNAQKVLIQTRQEEMLEARKTHADTCSSPITIIVETLLKQMGDSSSCSSCTNIEKAFNTRSVCLIPAYMPTPTLFDDKRNSNDFTVESQSSTSSPPPQAVREDNNTNITDGPLEFKLVTLDSNVRQIPIHNQSEATIGDFEGKTFVFPNGQTPSTKRLSDHARQCFQRALQNGWISRTEEPECFGSPLKDNMLIVRKKSRSRRASTSVAWQMH